MFSIETFSLQDMTDLSAEIRELGSGARTQESVADRIVKHLYEGFTLKKSGDKAFALARFFISLPFRELEQPLKALSNPDDQSRMTFVPIHAA